MLKEIEIYVYIKFYIESRRSQDILRNKYKHSHKTQKTSHTAFHPNISNNTTNFILYPRMTKYMQKDHSTLQSMDFINQVIDCISYSVKNYIASLQPELIITASVFLLSCAFLLFYSRAAQASPSLVSNKKPVPNPSKALPTQFRTFRISDIPREATNKTLRAYLNSLLSTSEADKFIYSLAPYNFTSTQVATVTFTERVPQPFSSCSQRRRIPSPSPKLGDNLIIDCNFLGITPLHSAEDPDVEYEVNCFSFSEPVRTRTDSFLVVLLRLLGFLVMLLNHGSHRQIIRCG
jgi:hypothetical protein